MSSPPKVAVVTHQTSPYQVELFDAIARSGGVQPCVIYLRSSHPTRYWGRRPIGHDHIILDDDPARWREAEARLSVTDLAVVNYYQHPFAHRTIVRRAASGRAWCFWGERTGVTRWAWAGGLYRRWKLRALHRSRSPIWGIGNFAVERYQAEFGKHRNYVNLPYFSDLTRFAAAARPAPAANGAVTFLYSGSLIARKGVDVLARAFARLADTFPTVRLRVVGKGECRVRMEAELAAHAGRVEFTGFKDWDELPEQYAHAHVLCAPSRHDGWGLVVPEALASGLPVIATDRMGAALDLVRPGSNGWRVAAGDGNELLGAMSAAARLSPAEWGRMSEAARASVRSHQLDDGVERFVRAAREAIAGWAT